jgi:tetratricopeptide (TPR) repeat protein
VNWYRKAIAADPTLWSARSQLGINLMRLGLDAEARSELEKCYQNGYRNEATVNSLRLLDSYRNFSFRKDDTTILKLHTREADVLYPYFLAELKRSMATYERKYQLKLSVPVQIEVYPDHEDFAVRTLGVPGLGALGVTFGNVVAMDSPSGRKPGEFHWASTLRHEMSHVYVLEATHHLVPRWFTEGLAVHEENQASPEWGDPMSPDIVVALRDRKLLPIADLNRGFVHPQFPAQVLVSYFQAGKICDYIQKRWGDAKLLEMIHAFAQITTTPEVIQHALGISAESFDQEFLHWLYERTPEPAHFDEWRDKFRQLTNEAQAKQYDDVIAHGAEVIHLYPDYVGNPNAYEFLAEAHLAKEDKSAAAKDLQAYVSARGWRPDTLMQLAQLQEDLGDRAAAAATLDRINSIDPLISDALHRRLGALWLAQHNEGGAIREFQAVLAMHPLDTASAQFDLAQAYFAAGQKDKAEDAVLASLEAAPGYRPAQKLLLQLKTQ